MILLNDFRRQWEDTGAATLEAVRAVGESAWYILGRETAAFEADLAAAWGVRHAVGVASGLDALEISLRVLGCGAGDRVLTTPLSAFATTLAIVKLGAVPVFVDTDARGLIDLHGCAALLEARPDIRYMVPVHLYGQALDPATLAAIRDRYGCRIVEDCAQSILATRGAVGAMAATSFYPTKNLGALGDGGAILSDDDAYAADARSYRDYGQSSKYRHDVIGYNSRLDELHAAIMRRALLPKLAGWTEARRRVAARYLAGISNPRVQPVAHGESVWHLFPVRVAKGSKPAFLAHLREAGILGGEHYPVLIPDQKALAGVAFETADPLPNARLLAECEVSLPIHPYLTDDEVEQVVECCNRWQG